MGLQYRKARVVLNYRETKPQMFKLVQLTYPAVTTEQLIAECATTCGVNPAQTKAVIDALNDENFAFAIQTLPGAEKAKVAVNIAADCLLKKKKVCADPKKKKKKER